MQYIILIVLLILLFIFLDYKGSVKRKFRNIQASLDKLSEDINALSNISSVPEQTEGSESEYPEEDIQEQNNEEEQEPAPETIEPETEVTTEEESSETSIAAAVNEPSEGIEINTPPITTKEKEPKEKRKTFFERHPDIEKFIGENLINKIGIVILVLGLGYLVKYAIDKNWINETGRVVIGIFSSSVLIGLAYKLRKNYKAFSSVLIGGGLALLYFTISLAFHTEGYPLYQQQTMSFILLILVTIFAVFLSVNYNRVEIAVFAMLGGFGSPLMVSDGGGNYIVLFSYLLILNAGMLILSYYKKWRLVNVLSFICTVLLFSSWLIKELNSSEPTSINGGVFFAIAFYVLFFLMNIIYNIKHKVEFKAGDIILVLANTFVHFGFTMAILNDISDGTYKGLVTIMFALFNFAFAFYVYKYQNESKKLLYLLIGLVLTFVTLAIPIQLKGNHITLFWSVEIALLLWLNQKSGFKVLKTGSVIVFILMIISLIMDWADSYNVSGINDAGYIKEYAIIFNKMFITSLVAAGSLIATILLLNRDKDNKVWIMPTSTYKLLLTIVTLAVLYIGGMLEVNYQTLHFFSTEPSHYVTKATYNSIFILSLLIFAIKQKQEEISYITAVIIPFFIVAFYVLISSSFAHSIVSIINNEEVYSNALLILRWVAVASAYAICAFSFRLASNISAISRINFRPVAIVMTATTAIYLLSSDLDAIAMLVTKNKDIVSQTHKTGYAILWGISSFIFMIIGMKIKVQIIRILSLILFAITMLKLFIYDISGISEGGKIVAFILLGILLLIISFMYQRLKRLVIADSSEEENPNE